METTLDRTVADLVRSVVDLSRSVCVPEASAQRLVALKGAHDSLVAADLFLEARILDEIRARWPDHGVVSEEAGGALDGAQSFRWVVDPLCGSNNFRFGLPIYGVSFALLRGQEFEFGCIVLPAQEEVLTAWKGRGAELNGVRLLPPPRRPLCESLILYDNQLAVLPGAYRNLESLAQSSFAIRMTGSAAWDNALVATGRAGARVFHSTKLFDFAAAAVIVPEVGGVVIDFEGRDVTARSKEVLVSSSPELAVELRALFRR